MARSGSYDVVLADIRLPDMTGYDCFSQMQQVTADVPVILMTGFGYDPSHSIVKARKEGLETVLYKPFRVDQLLEAVEKAVTKGKTGGAKQAVAPGQSSGQ
jgi:DNA-binding NtrC family response regulator